MSILPATLSPLDALQSAASATVSSNGSAAGRLARGVTPDAPMLAPQETGATALAAEGARVSLSNATAAAQPHVPAPVYAEIWRDGVKVAVVDSHGSVDALNGFLAPAQTGGGGANAAARRAAQIAHAVGGEIRVAGQVVDAQTLSMRAKLKQAYGV